MAAALTPLLAIGGIGTCASINSGCAGESETNQVSDESAEAAAQSGEDLFERECERIAAALSGGEIDLPDAVGEVNEARGAAGREMIHTGWAFCPMLECDPETGEMSVEIRIATTAQEAGDICDAWRSGWL